MGIKFGPGTTISGFQHPGGGGGGGGSGLQAPSAIATDPFNGSGPSWNFNGSNNAVTVDVNTYSMNPSGSDWCVEGFFYQSDNNAFPRIFSIGAYPSASIAISLEGGSMLYWLNNGVAASPSKPATNSWHHFAFSHTNGTTSFYLDGGLASSTATDMPDISGQTLYIGVESATGIPNVAFGGYINSFRWTVGNPVYTGEFAVPTAMLQSIQSAGTNINEITSGQVRYVNPTSTTYSGVQADGNSGSNSLHLDTSYTWASTIPAGATATVDGYGIYTVVDVLDPASNISNNWQIQVTPNTSNFASGTAITFSW